MAVVAGVSRKKKVKEMKIKREIAKIIYSTKPSYSSGQEDWRKIEELSKLFEVNLKKVFEVALKWLPIEIYEEVVDEVSYNKALQKQNYNSEYIQDLKVLRGAYLDLKGQDKR